MPSNHFHPSFTRIHDNLYISNPSLSTTSASPPGSSSPPTIILFLAWGNAPSQPIKKYTTHYTTLYPTATIILFLTTFSELILHTPNRQTKPLSPAIDAILAAAATTTAGRNSRTLVHLFSNGGAYKLRELASAYRSLTSHMLPMDLLILDSAPGLPDYARSVAAFQTQFSARRASSSSAAGAGAGAGAGAVVFYLGTALVYAYLSFMYVFGRVSGRVPITRQVWEGLNDVLVVGTRARRVYLYSESDALIGWRDVVAHAEDAERKGYRVRRVEFEGSRHVAHVVVDRERYWGAIVEEWEAVCCASDSSA